MRKKQRIIAGASLAAGLVAGGGAGLVLGAATGSAGAEAPAAAAVADPSTPPPATPDSTPPTPSTDQSGTATPKPTVDREQRIRDLLQPLVDDGTITAAQLDAIVAKLDAAGPAVGGGHGGPGMPGRDGKRGIVGMGLDTVATTLGMTEAEVRTALESGTSLKALAESKGKTAQDLIDALVAETKSKLDEQVTNGKLTQAEADTMLATATTFITDAVNNGFPKGFPMGGPGGEHRREAKPDAGSGTGSDSTPSSTPSTTTG